jgi:superfamily II DNA helicase RecQ
MPGRELDDDNRLLTRSGKQAANPHIRERHDKINGLSMKEAIGVMVRNTKGEITPYKHADRAYDIKGGYLLVGSSVQINRRSAAHVGGGGKPPTPTPAPDQSSGRAADDRKFMCECGREMSEGVALSNHQRVCQAAQSVQAQVCSKRKAPASQAPSKRGKTAALETSNGGGGAALAEDSGSKHVRSNNKNKEDKDYWTLKELQAGGFISAGIGVITCDHAGPKISADLDADGQIVYAGGQVVQRFAKPGSFQRYYFDRWAKGHGQVEGNGHKNGFIVVKYKGTPLDHKRLEAAEQAQQNAARKARLDNTPAASSAMPATRKCGPTSAKSSDSPLSAAGAGRMQAQAQAQTKLPLLKVQHPRAKVPPPSASPTSPAEKAEEDQESQPCTLTSQYRGVSWSKQRQKWRATITVDCKKHWLGDFDVEQDAAEAYDAAAQERLGHKATLNFALKECDSAQDSVQSTGPRLSLSRHKGVHNRNGGITNQDRASGSQASNKQSRSRSEPPGKETITSSRNVFVQERVYRKASGGWQTEIDASVGKAGQVRQADGFVAGTPLASTGACGKSACRYLNGAVRVIARGGQERNVPLHMGQFVVVLAALAPGVKSSRSQHVILQIREIKQCTFGVGGTAGGTFIKGYCFRKMQDMQNHLRPTGARQMLQKSLVLDLLDSDDGVDEDAVAMLTVCVQAVQREARVRLVPEMPTSKITLVEDQQVIEVDGKEEEEGDRETQKKEKEEAAARPEGRAEDEAEEEWLNEGHKWLGQRMRRFNYDSGGTVVDGTVRLWVRAGAGEPALWRVVHDDGDKEDLEELEVVQALQDFQNDERHTEEEMEEMGRMEEVEEVDCNMANGMMGEHGDDVEYVCTHEYHGTTKTITALRRSLPFGRNLESDDETDIHGTGRDFQWGRREGSPRVMASGNQRQYYTDFSLGGLRYNVHEMVQIWYGDQPSPLERCFPVNEIVRAFSETDEEGQSVDMVVVHPFGRIGKHGRLVQQKKPNNPGQKVRKRKAAEVEILSAAGPSAGVLVEDEFRIETILHHANVLFVPTCAAQSRALSLPRSQTGENFFVIECEQPALPVDLWLEPSERAALELVSQGLDDQVNQFQQGERETLPRAGGSSGGGGHLHDGGSGRSSGCLAKTQCLIAFSAADLEARTRSAAANELIAKETVDRPLLEFIDKLRPAIERCPGGTRSRLLRSIEEDREVAGIRGGLKMDDITYVVAGKTEEAYVGDSSHDEELHHRLKELFERKSCSREKQEADAEAEEDQAAAAEEQVGQEEQADQADGCVGWRPLQLKTCRAVLAGEDVVMQMRCGAGKSLCYQLPALLQPGLTVVIEPYKSVVNDQCRELRSMGIHAEAISQDNPPSQRRLDKIYESVCGDHSSGGGGTAQPLRLVYMTAEKLLDHRGVGDLLTRLNNAGRLSRIVIDEFDYAANASFSFRSCWLRFHELRTRFLQPGTDRPVPVLATSAVSTPSAVRSIVESMHAKNVVLFAADDFTSQLHYRVERKGSKTDAVERVEYLLTHGEYGGATALVYCCTIKTCEWLADALRKRSIEADHYHSKLVSSRKEELDQQWHSNQGKPQVLVATRAFGRGVNNPNVRQVCNAPRSIFSDTYGSPRDCLTTSAQVIHFDLPMSLSDLYQEAGRAGRDRKPANHTLLFDPADRKQTEALHRKGDGLTDDRKCDLDAVEAYAASTECRSLCLERAVSLPKVLESHTNGKRDCGLCDNCLAREKGIDFDVTAEAVAFVRRVVLGSPGAAAAGYICAGANAGNRVFAVGQSEKEAALEESLVAAGVLKMTGGVIGPGDRVSSIIGAGGGGGGGSSSSGCDGLESGGACASASAVSDSSTPSIRVLLRQQPQCSSSACCFSRLNATGTGVTRTAPKSSQLVATQGASSGGGGSGGGGFLKQCAKCKHSKQGHTAPDHDQSPVVADASAGTNAIPGGNRPANKRTGSGGGRAAAPSSPSRKAPPLSPSPAQKSGGGGSGIGSAQVEGKRGGGGSKGNGGGGSQAPARNSASKLRGVCPSRGSTTAEDDGGEEEGQSQPSSHVPHPKFPRWMLCDDCSQFLSDVKDDMTGRCSVCAHPVGHVSSSFIGCGGAAGSGSGGGCSHLLCKECFCANFSWEEWQRMLQPKVQFYCPVCVQDAASNDNHRTTSIVDEVEDRDGSSTGADAMVTEMDTGTAVQNEGEVLALRSGYNSELGLVTKWLDQLLPQVPFEVAWAVECFVQREGPVAAHKALAPLLADHDAQQKLAEAPSYAGRMQLLMEALHEHQAQRPVLIEGRAVAGDGDGRAGSKGEVAEESGEEGIAGECEVMVYTATAHVEVTQSHAKKDGAEAIPDRPRVRLHPAKAGIARRLTRKFGSSRIAYVTVERRTPQTLRNLLEEGFVAGGRRWEFLVPLPDENLARNMRLIFFATSGRGITADEEMSADAVRLWHFQPRLNFKIGLTDFIKRFKLALSTTVATITLTAGQIVNIDDVWSVETREIQGSSSGSGGTQGATSGALLTEGCGLISSEAMEAVARRLNLNATPSAVQGRIGAAKGLWVRCADESWAGVRVAKAMEDGDGMWIGIRPSQLKFELPPSQADAQQRTLEVCSYSSHTDNRPSRINRQLVRILNHRGVPLETFEALQDEQVAKLRLTLECEAGHELEEWASGLVRAWGDRQQSKRRRDQAAGAMPAERQSAIEEASSVSGRADEMLCAMLDAGFSLHHPLLRGPIFRIVRAAMRDQLCLASASGIFSDTHKGSAKMKLTVEKSRHLLIAPDPSGGLRKGECFVRLGNHGDVLEGPVLLARFPIYFHTCLRVATAVKPSRESPAFALRDLPNVLFLPAPEVEALERSAADELSGGDYDGDAVWVCWDKRLVDPVQQLPPTDYPQQLPKATRKNMTKMFIEGDVDADTTSAATAAGAAGAVTAGLDEGGERSSPSRGDEGAALRQTRLIDWFFSKLVQWPMISRLATAHERFCNSHGVGSKEVRELARLCHQQVDTPDEPRQMPKFAMEEKQSSDGAGEDEHSGDDDDDKEMDEANEGAADLPSGSGRDDDVVTQLHERGLELVAQLAQQWQRIQQKWGVQQMPQGVRGAGEGGAGAAAAASSEPLCQWHDPDLEPQTDVQTRAQIKCLIAKRMSALHGRMNDIYQQAEAQAQAGPVHDRQGWTNSRMRRGECDKLYATERQWAIQEFATEDKRKVAALVTYEHTIE